MNVDNYASMPKLDLLLAEIQDGVNVTRYKTKKPQRRFLVMTMTKTTRKGSSRKIA